MLFVYSAIVEFLKTAPNNELKEKQIKCMNL